MKTENGSYLKSDKLVKKEIFTFTDYVEVLELTSENPYVYETFWNRQDMVKIAESWYWEQALDDGMDVMKIWEERDWFEYQIVCALDDGNLATFGDY